MKIGIGQINSIIGDFEYNRRTILDQIRKGHSEGIKLIVFPEMALCGYPPMDLLDNDLFLQKNIESLRILQKTCPEGIAAAVGHIDKNRKGSGKSLQNVVSVIYNGKIIHTQAKTLLPTYDVFDETRYFEPAEESTVFSFENEKIGIAVCEDLWYETGITPRSYYQIDPVKRLVEKGVTLIIAPSASPFHHGKAKQRRSITSKISSKYGVGMVYVNMTGGNDNLIFDGRSIVSSSDGSIIYQGKAFNTDYFSIDTELTHPARSFQESKYEDIENALITGTRDYLQKCGFSKVHLGLSGGIDSALTAVIAVKAMGQSNVTAFALPSRYSSKNSLIDAEALKDNLKIKFEVLSIESMFSETLLTLKPVFKGAKPDLTEENIQARIRGLLLMAYSNKTGSLLLATGNKSELATGYCTLYGDMCGGLSVIGDLFKTEVFELCRYINRDKTIIPESIITKPPSAELRPDQKDEDSLPPYERLDAILSYHLLDNLSVEEITEKDFDKKEVTWIIDLIGKTEHKRRQAPPVLKVSERAFGTGRRIPIAGKK